MQSLVALLEEGRARKDVGGEIIDELGYAGGMWNRSAPSVGLTFHCGASFMPIGNNVVLQLPNLENGGASLVEPEVADTILNAVVEAWSPEWATWTTDGWRQAQAPTPGQPVVGWLTHLRGVRPDGMPADLASVASGTGALVSAAPTFSAVTEERILAVRDALDSAGALRLPVGRVDGDA